MAKAIALTRAYVPQMLRPAELLRAGVVFGCALALVAARGPLPII